MTLNELRVENDQLRRMLNFERAYHDYGLVPASLMTQDISLVFKTVVINRGSRWGVHRNMPIVTPEGMLGRVVSVSPSTAQVLMITDPYSAVPAVVLRSRVKGVVKGTGRGYLTLEYVRKNADVRVGDCLVTSDLSGVFPKGFKLGQVTSIRHSKHDIFARITLRPYVAMDKVEEVFGVKAHVALNQ
jgi:rod shape-determining protein MreC